MEIREAKTRGNFFKTAWNSTAITEVLKWKRGKAFCAVIVFVLSHTNCWYRRGHGFESRSGLNVFQALISQLSCVYNCDGQS